jgi:FAD/FMN-containing dehydrogenase
MTSEINWLERLKKRCDDVDIVTDPDILISHGRDWTRFREPSPRAVAFPKSIENVQALVRFASRNGIGLVPSGGRTGLSGGAVACAGELVVSFDRMNRIIDFNRVDRTVTVEAGVVTATLQQFAVDQGLYYPVSFASEGSSQIGGNIATNAGGIRVLRHGLTRDRVLGLSVVTHDGVQIVCNRGLVKNASGYDLRHLFVASEGTLGLIVEATLQLVDPPPDSRVLLLGLRDIDAMMEVFALFREDLTLSAFEFLTNLSLSHVREAHGLPAPLDSECPLYVVLEFDCEKESEEKKALASFEQCVEAGWVVDGVISQSRAQAKDLWRYREGISEAISARLPYKNDLAVRVSQVPEFLRSMGRLVMEHCPGFEVLWYGHIGDGNLHMNILKPVTMDVSDFEQQCHEVSGLTYALTRQMGGTISAEHGIGLLKKDWLDQVRQPEEIALMRRVKHALDPDGIFNPGKLFPDE